MRNFYFSIFAAAIITLFSALFFTNSVVVASDCSDINCGTCEDCTYQCMCGTQLMDTHGQYCCADYNDGEGFIGDESSCEDACGLSPSPSPSPGSLGTAASCEQYCQDTIGYNQPTGQVCICNPLKVDKFEDIVGNIFDLLFKIVLILTPLMVVVGGVLFVTAAGNVERVTQAKRILIWTAIGFLVVLLSRGIVGIIETILGKS